MNALKLLFWAIITIAVLAIWELYDLGKPITRGLMALGAKLEFCGLEG